VAVAPMAALQCSARPARRPANQPAWRQPSLRLCTVLLLTAWLVVVVVPAWEIDAKGASLQLVSD